MNNIETAADYETVKIWLEELFNNELMEVQGSISNENIFLLGSKDEESQKCHARNIETLGEYFNILTNLKKEALASIK